MHRLAVLLVALAAAGTSGAGVKPDAPLELVVVQPTAGRLAAAREAVLGVGGRVELTAHGHLQALVPSDQVPGLERTSAVDDVAPAPIASADVVTSGGVARIGADELHGSGLDGAGTRIVILDTAFGDPSRLDTLAPAELPVVPADHRASFDHTFGLQGADYFGTYSAHGEEVAEIAYDIAPAAEYWYVNYRTADEFGQAVQYVESLHPDIVVHSNSFLFGPFDGTGWFAKRVDEATAQGILWVNSAGNYRLKHWEGRWTDANGDGSLDIPGHGDSIPFAFVATSRPACDLSWTDADPTGNNRYTLAFYLDPAGTQPALDKKTGNPIVSSFVPSPEPHADLGPAFLSAGGTYYLRVKRVGDPSGARLTLFCRQGLPADVDVTSSSSPTPGDARDALSVGAFNVNSLLIQDYSTEGPTDDGRMKPDLAAPTGVAVVGGYFSGTSAAAPHVGGEAALIWTQFADDANVANVPRLVAARLRTLALDMGPPGEDPRWGTGRTRVDVTPPALGVTTPAPGAGVAGTLSYRLPLAEAGTIESASVAFDGSPTAAVLGPDLALTGLVDTRRLPDGVHHLRATASDQSGNVGNFDLPVRIDNSGPSLGPMSAGKAKVLSRIQTIRVALVDPSGIATVSGSIEGRPVAGTSSTDGTYSTTLDTRSLPDGRHELRLAATDGLGNTSVLSLPFVADNTPPRLVLLAPRRALVGTRLRVRVRASDATAGIAGRPRVSFGDGASAYAPAVHRYRRAGPFRIRVRVVDAVGNRATLTRVLTVVRRRAAG